LRDGSVTGARDRCWIDRHVMEWPYTLKTTHGVLAVFGCGCPTQWAENEQTSTSSPLPSLASVHAQGFIWERYSFHQFLSTETVSFSHIKPRAGTEKGAKRFILQRTSFLKIWRERNNKIFNNFAWSFDQSLHFCYSFISYWGNIRQGLREGVSDFEPDFDERYLKYSLAGDSVWEIWHRVRSHVTRTVRGSDFVV